MQKILISFVLLLTTGAFLSFLVPPSEALAVTLKGDAQLQWLWAVIDGTVVLACAMRWKDIRSALKSQTLLLLFIVWGALSISWSDAPALTFRRIVGLVCTSALGFYLGARVDIRGLLRLVAMALGIAIAGSLLAGLLFPAYGIMSGGLLGDWRGLYPHKNTMARIMGFAVVTFLSLLLDAKRGRVVYASLLAGACALIVLSHSASAAVITLASVLIALWRRLRVSTMFTAATFSMIAIAAVLLGTMVLSDPDQVFAILGKDSTLTGRTSLWEFSFEAVKQDPWFGAGWDVFWSTAHGDRIRALVGWDAPHAHNAFLDFSLNVGVPGLCIYLIGLVSCIRRALRYSQEPSHPFREWPLMFYLFILFYMFPETMLVDRHSLFEVLLIALSVAMEKERPVCVVGYPAELRSRPLPTEANLSVVASLT